MGIRIAIVEDQGLLRELLGGLLAREPEFVLVGQAATGAQALELAARERPDVVLLDVSLPDMDGVEVARRLRARVPEARVIGLSIHDEPGVVRAMLDAGAAGYVLKDEALGDLVDAIRDAMQSRIHVSPRLAREALGRRLAGIERPRLARREREVVALIAQGQRTADIARTLGISVATVEVHRRNILRKLGLKNVAELTRYAIREGLVRP